MSVATTLTTTTAPGRQAGATPPPTARPSSTTRPQASQADRRFTLGIDLTPLATSKLPAGHGHLTMVRRRLDVSPGSASRLEFTSDASFPVAQLTVRFPTKDAAIAPSGEADCGVQGGEVVCRLGPLKGTTASVDVLPVKGGAKDVTFQVEVTTDDDTAFAGSVTAPLQAPSDGTEGR